MNESLARRINARMDFEISASYRGVKGYKRLRSASVLLSAPNAEQMMLFIEAIHEFAASLNGKWLAAKPVEASAQPAAGASHTLSCAQSGE